MTTPTQKLLPPHRPATPATTGNTADLAVLAAQTAAETERAIPPPTTATATDAYGRIFDRELHVHALDGTPAVNKRTGQLLCLPGKGLGKVRSRGKAVTGTPASSSLNLESAASPPGSPPVPAPGSAIEDAPGSPPGSDAGTDAPPPLDPVAVHNRADRDAGAIKRGLRMLGRWLAGEKGEYEAQDGEDEGAEVKEAWAIWLENSGNTLPLGDLGIALLASGRYVQRCWQSEKHQERVKGWSWWPFKGGAKRPATPPTQRTSDQAPETASGDQRQPEGPPEMHNEYFS